MIPASTFARFRMLRFSLGLLYPLSTMAARRGVSLRPIDLTFQIHLIVQSVRLIFHNGFALGSVVFLTL